LHYPRGGDFRAAEKLEISSGNFRFADIKTNFTRFRARTRGAQSIVLSSEYFFHEIASSAEPLHFFKELGYELNVLVFTRNPVSHIMSGYSQAVKREGFWGTIDEFIASRDYRIQHPFELAQFIKHCDATDTKLTLENYDRNSRRILEILFAFLETDTQGLKLPDRVVNRSLNRTELEIVRVMGEIFGQRVAQEISDSLCNELPGISSSSIFPSVETLTVFCDNVRPAVHELEHICRGRFHPYDIDFESDLRSSDSNYLPQVALPVLEQARIIRDRVVAGIPAEEFARIKIGDLLRRLKRRTAFR
jgi:hypothetical protein